MPNYLLHIGVSVHPWLSMVVAAVVFPLEQWQSVVFVESFAGELW
jgi:hypothetical protein